MVETCVALKEAIERSTPFWRVIRPKPRRVWTRPSLSIVAQLVRHLSLVDGRLREAITILVYDRRRLVTVNLLAVHPRKLAAVRREVAPGAVGSAWEPAIGKVWPVIRR